MIYVLKNFLVYCSKNDIILHDSLKDYNLMWYLFNSGLNKKTHFMQPTTN